MATVQNRSPYTVAVPKHPELTKTFPYTKLKAVKLYVDELKTRRLRPEVSQGDNAVQVRVRKKGYADQIATFSSSAEADVFLKKTEAEQAQGLFRNYVAARNVTAAELIARYIREECPKLKGGSNYAIMLNAMLADSTHELRKAIEQREQEMRHLGRCVTKYPGNRVPMSALEWLHKPMPEITTLEVEQFITERLEFVEPSTVCRQLDLLRSVFNVAINVWDYHVDRHPMANVRRPQFFNERDRRLVGEEEERLLDAIRMEDKARSIENRVQELLAPAREHAANQSSTYASKLVIRDAYDTARREAEASYKHIPFMEAFFMFQVSTAARRGESLSVTWKDIDFKAKTAFVEKTKNGRPRHLSVRQGLLDMLQQLPRTSDRVFDILEKRLRTAWGRICDNAKLEDFHIHDIRHEAISRAAESGLFPTVMDLQAYSGHRETRSLSRYTHMLPSIIADRLELLEETRQQAKQEQNSRMATGMMGAGQAIGAVGAHLAGMHSNVISANFRRGG